MDLSLIHILMCIRDRVGVNAPVITYNGAMVYDMEKGTALNSLTIDLETARGICCLLYTSRCV